MSKSTAKKIVYIGVLFTSLSSILIKGSSSPALIISFYRMLFASLILTPPFVYSYYKNEKSIPLKTFSLCLLSGIFLALHFATWVQSIKYTSISISTILVCLSPIFVSLLSLFIFKEKLSKTAIFGIFIALLGSIVIAASSTSASGPNPLLGNLLALLGAIFASFYMVIGRTVRQDLDALSYVFMVYWGSTATLLVLSLSMKIPIYPYPASELILFLGLAFFCSILGHSFYNIAMGYLPATFISTATLGEPIYATLMAFFIYNEQPSGQTLLGIAIIIMGLFTFTRASSPEKKEPLSGPLKNY